MKHKLIIGDALEVLKKFDSNSIQLAITSPPYFQLRDYSTDREIGKESEPDEYLSNLLEIFAEIYRVIREDGSFYLNISDRYQEKTLLLLPERLIIGLKELGFFVRNAIIWLKTTTITAWAPDRFTTRWEYIFFLTKSKDYYFDPEPLSVNFAETTIKRLEKFARDNYPFDPSRHKVYKNYDHSPSLVSCKIARRIKEQGKSKRHPFDVWPFASASFKGAHEATFPLELPLRAILASSKQGDTVLDPFVGSGTTMEAAEKLRRNSIGIDLNPLSIDLVKERFSKWTSQQRLGEEFSLKIYESINE